MGSRVRSSLQSIMDYSLQSEYSLIIENIRYKFVIVIDKVNFSDQCAHTNAVPASDSENIPAVTLQMQKVLDYVKANGQITEKEISELLGLKKNAPLLLQSRCGISD